MKLRYYLRGLGIGIVVTAIIMSFTRQPEKLTDAQIKMRALELGMVEESVLADLQEEKELASNEGDNVQDKIPAFEDIVEVETEEAETETEETEAETEETETEETEIETEMAEESSIVEEEENVTSESIELNDGVDSNNASTELPKDEAVESYIVISVEGGNDSYTVSEKLYEAGLVNSAVEFNQYLVRNGYDRRVRPGNHEIPANATEEEMAKILCKMN